MKCGKMEVLKARCFEETHGFESIPFNHVNAKAPHCGCYPPVNMKQLTVPQITLFSEVTKVTINQG